MNIYGQQGQNLLAILRIIRGYEKGKWFAYAYDALGQLIRLNDRSDPRGSSDGSTWMYTYDQGGNILSKKLYPYADTSVEPISTMTFTYGDANWRDKLTAVNGVPITYDAIGNPLNDGTWTYTWQNGRQLKSMSKSGTTASFVYNADGLRVQKTVNGVVTKYTLHGKNVVHMTSGSDELHFFYDAQNRPAVVVYNGTAYAYAKNLQGDIVGILDNVGNWVVEYTYDAWGAPTSRTGSMADTLGVVNPFRYRGYVYDQETGLYYLRSRYYNPAWCRFLNMDLITSGNTFWYCNNAPILKVDKNGMSPDEEDLSIWDIIPADQIGVTFFPNAPMLLLDQQYYTISIKEINGISSTHVVGEKQHTAYRYDQTSGGQKQLWYTGKYNAATDKFTFLYESDMVQVNASLVDYDIGYEHNYVFGNQLLAYNKNGHYKEEVYRLQMALAEEGYLPWYLVRAGYFDEHTQSALCSYQTAMGITADGKAGNETKYYLLPAYYRSLNHFQ